MNLVSRPWKDEADYARMRALLQAQPDVRERGAQCTIGDLDWWRCISNDPNPMGFVQLWFDDGDANRLAAFVWREDGRADLFLDPAYRAAERELIAWIVANAGETRTLEITAYDRDLERQRLLAEAGFVRTDEHYTYRTYPLNGALPSPLLPPGYSVQDMVGATPERIERRVEVHRAAWAPSRMTVAKHTAVMQSPTYRPDLDLVVVAPDGAFASCTIVWHDPVNAIGVFEPVGCDPAYRQLGLTKALMHDGLRRLQALGARNAFVNSWYDSLPANRLYERSGFQLVDFDRKWVRTFAAPGT